MDKYLHGNSASGHSALRSPFLMESEDHIELLPPVAGDDKLLFQGFCNGLPIAFARLKRIRPDEAANRKVVQLLAAVRPATWSLQSIQVAQNFRGRGIGSALLREILHHCHHHGIQRLVGEMKGDLPALRRWYARHGFQLCADDRLELLLR